MKLTVSFATNGYKSDLGINDIIKMELCTVLLHFIPQFDYLFTYLKKTTRAEMCMQLLSFIFYNAMNLNKI